MSTLTSLLVRDQIVSIRAIEEAIQRQVISGGDLPSVLLEMGAVSENTLVSYLAAQYGLAPAGREEVMSIPEAILGNVSAELAIDKRILPIGEAAGRLLIASARPLVGDERRELGFAIGSAIEIRITLDLRIAAGLHRHYGETLSRREQRLLRKIDAGAPGELRTVMPLDPNRVFNRDDEEREDAEIRPLAPTRFTHEGKASQRAEQAQEAQEISQTVEPERLSAAPRAPGRASNPALPISPEVAAGSGDEARRSSPPIAQPVELLSAARPTSSQIERHRGPLTAKRAVEMLGKAETRDEILAIAMAFIRQFFDYTALFVVHDDEAEGLDAYGSGPDYRAIQKLSVPLDAANAFGKTREERLPRVLRLGREESEREFIAKAKRESAQPSLVAPIAIEHRVILVLYADREGEELSIPDIPEVIAFLPRIGDALKQLILKRKRQTMRSEPLGAQAFKEAPRTKPSEPALRQASVKKVETVEASDGARRRPRFAVPLELPKAPERERSRTLELLGITREEPRLPDFETLLRSREERQEEAQGQGPVALHKRAPAIPSIKKPAAQAKMPPTIEPKAQQKIEREVDPRSSSGAAPQAKGAQEARIKPPPLRTSSAEARPKPPATKPPPIRRARVSERPLPTVHRGDEGRVDIIDTSAIKRTPGAPRSLPPPPLPSAERREEAVIGRMKSGGMRAPSAAIAAERGEESERESIVVEDDGSVEAKIEALALMKPSESAPLIREIVAAGSERALTPLVRAFPGEIFFLRSVGPLPRPAEISSVARAIAAFGSEAEHAIAALLTRPSADTRYYALAIAKEAMTPIVAGALTALLHDDDRELRRQALELLRSLDLRDPALRRAADALIREASDTTKDSAHRKLALDDLGTLGVIESAEDIARLVDDQEGAISAAARSALIRIFADDMGPESDAWLKLIEARGGRHRVQYLIDGLLHDDEPIRREAGAELQRISREYLGYHAGLPRREREVLKRRYEEWWEERGRGIFLGDGGA